MNNTDRLLRLFTEEPAPLAVCERPAMRVDRYGVDALSDSELLALALQGTMSADVAIETARKIINEAGSFASLSTWTPEEFSHFGLGKLKGLQLSALPEIARRFATSHRCADLPLLNDAHRIAEHFHPMCIGLEVEKFWVAALNRKNRLIRAVAITSGTATAALAHPREVFRVAIRYSAAAIICIHNHPSGDPAPSAPDLHVTRLLREAAKAVDIQLLDHVIIGRAAADPTGKGHFSFRDAGML